MHGELPVAEPSLAATVAEKLVDTTPLTLTHTMAVTADSGTL